MWGVRMGGLRKMTCIVNPDDPKEVILRNPTFTDRLAVLFLPKGKEIVFSCPTVYEGEEEDKIRK